jgi:hypothetical protein
MSLSEAIATQAVWIQVWVNWLSVVTFATIAVLMIKPMTRRTGGVIAIATIANFLLMQWFYGQFGYVRLLGLAHILVWTPLALYLFFALKTDAINGWVRRFVQVFTVSICISLVFDYVDVARWLLGERGSMLPA